MAFLSPLIGDCRRQERVQHRATEAGGGEDPTGLQRIVVYHYLFLICQNTLP